MRAVALCGLTSGLLVLPLPPGSEARVESLSYPDLVSRITDLERLAVLPDPGETCAQASSYDRASRYDALTDEYIDWDANNDDNGIVRVEDGRQVLADIKGPGCIWRIWSAEPGPGHVRIYLDGSEQPAVDLPFVAWFDGRHEPFTDPGLVYMTSQGRNNRVPIPFQRTCRIVADEGWGRYYHFTYTRFPEGTAVPVFSRDLGLRERAALAKASAVLTLQSGRDPAPSRKGQQISARTVTLDPGQRTRVLTVRGPAAITSLTVRLGRVGASETADVLRMSSILATWDGERLPAVWAPLGDFFGTGPGHNEYRSLPLGFTPDGMYCHWYMPFASAAVIEIANDSRTRVEYTVSATVAPLSRPVEHFARFHAKWHRGDLLQDRTDRMRDWTFIRAQGRGRFCGVALEVWNPRGAWWGEGDEKFFVDGEKMPSTFGTGTEDYFGYAWCDSRVYEYALHNQTRNDNRNKGHISVNRWHIADSVPFQERFEGCIEKWNPDSHPTLYAAISYWYQEAGIPDPYTPVPSRERSDWYPAATAPAVPGVLEGESMRVVGVTSGHASRTETSGFGPICSDDGVLAWTGGPEGSSLVIRFPAPTEGQYQIQAGLLRAADYGSFRLAVNGRPARNALDLKGEMSVVQVDLGEQELKRKDNSLTVTVVRPGRDASPIAAYLGLGVFGLDYVKLTRVR